MVCRTGGARQPVRYACPRRTVATPEVRPDEPHARCAVAVTLIGTALRELWISYRLLVVLAALLMAALPVALLPPVLSPDLAGAPPDPLTWMALVAAGGMTLAAELAAATIAGERRRARAGWIATRVVPLAAIAPSWFAAFALLLVVGLAPVGILAWLALGPFLAVGPGALAAAILATACAGCVVLACGLLAGAVLPVWPAAAVTAAAGAAVLVPPVMRAPTGWLLPADGLRVLAELDTAARPVADSLRAAGVALGVAAAVVVLAVIACERADR